MEKFTTSIDIGGFDLPDTSTHIPEGNGRIRDLEFEKKEVREKHRPKSAFKFYFFNIILGMLILGVGLFLWVKFFCALTDVEYEGITNSNPSEIRTALLSYDYCDNAIYAWGINLVKDHAPIPFVRDVNVYLKDKNTVVVSVKEDELYGVFEVKGKYLYIDSAGNVVEHSKKFVENVPIITGITVPEFEDGKPLDISKTQKNIILNMIKYLREDGIYPQIIEFEKDGSFGCFINGIFVDLGMSTDIREKCERLPHILPNLEGEQGTLHLEEWGRENSDIIFEKSN